MNARINFNGSFLEAEAPLVTADNRGLRYGDGLFETMKVVNGKISLGSLHFDRLMKGIQLLQLRFSKQVNASYFEEQVYRTMAENKVNGAARVRLMVFRGNGGLYDTEAMSNFVIQCVEIPGVKPFLSETGLQLGVYHGARKACDALSGLKSNNYLPYAMAALHAKQHGYHDCLLLNSHERICESTISNIFWIKNKTICTPPLSEGCIAGVMRRHLLEVLPVAGYAVNEQPAFMEELEKAEEIFLTNAISGLRWVGALNGVEFGNTIGSRIFHSVILGNGSYL